jgi:penicillin-binding protein 1A
VELIDKIKPENVIDFATRLGITSKLDPFHSLALGTSDVALDEMVAAYSSFVNLGIYTKPYYITRIEDKYGNVIANFVPVTKFVMNDKVAYTMVHMLKGGVEEEGGTSRALNPSVLTDNEVGGKTGTTDDASDGWYIGITHNLVTGVWVGGEQPSIHLPPGFGSGSKSALPIWDKFMTQVYDHPQVQYLKGKFKAPLTLDELRLNCDDYKDDPY